MHTAHTHLASFNGYPIEIIDHNGQPWLTGEQIGRAIGLKHARQGITKIYHRHADEFTDQMSTEVDVGSVDGKRRPVRVYSPRGAWMLAMWAQTDQAKQFRVWVLDVLEKQSQMSGLEIPSYVRRELLNAYPKWRQIARYKALGLDNREIGKLVGWHPSTVRKHLRRMEQCGVIEPPNNLPHMQQMALRLLGGEQ